MTINRNNLPWYHDQMWNGCKKEGIRKRKDTNFTQSIADVIKVVVKD